MLAQGGGAAKKEARRRGNAILPYLSAPGSFKRMLGCKRSALPSRPPYKNGGCEYQ